MAERKVELRLDVKMPAETKRALEETARSMDKAAASNDKLNKSLADTAAAARRPGGPAGGGTYGLAPLDANRVGSAVGPAFRPPREPRAADRAGAAAAQGGGGAVGMGIGAAVRERLAGLPGTEITSAAFDRQAMAARGAIAAAAVRYGVEYAGQAADSMYNARAVGDLGGTAGEARRVAVNSNFLTRNTVGVGQDFWDSASGRNYEMARASRRGREMATESEARERLRVQENEARRTQNRRGLEANALEAAYAADPAPTVSQFDRSTVGGERRFREESQLAPVRERLTGARAAESAARRDAGMLEDEQGQLAARRRGLEQEARALSARAGGLEGPEREKALEAEKVKREEIAAALAEEQQLLAKTGAARAQEIQAMKERKEVETQLKQAQLAQLQQREQVATGQARRLGQMNEFEIRQGIDAARMVKRAGAEGAAFLPDEVRARARAFAPETVGKIEEEVGRQQRLKLGIDLEFGDEFKDDVGKIRGELGKLQDEITLKIRLDATEAKKQAAQLEKDFIPALRDLFDSVISNALKKLKQEQLDQQRGVGAQQKL